MSFNPIRPNVRIVGNPSLCYSNINAANYLLSSPLNKFKMRSTREIIRNLFLAVILLVIPFGLILAKSEQGSSAGSDTFAEYKGNGEHQNTSDKQPVSPLGSKEEDTLTYGESNSDTIYYVMDEFEVSSEKDRGYHSANVLAGTRTNQAIIDTPMTISVLNQQLIKDMNLSEIDQISMVVPSIENEGEVFSNNLMRFRGLLVRNQIYEFFTRSAPQNYYNVERVEAIRGANSLVYGQASPGGKANIHAKKALFSNPMYNLQIERGNNELSSIIFDVNNEVSERLALRIMGIRRKQNYDQNFKALEFEGGTLAASYQPTRKTTFEAHFEYFNETRNNPRLVEKDDSHNKGFTGIMANLPMTERIVEFLSKEALEEIINYEDNIISTKNPTQLNIESADDLRRYYSSLTSEKIGITSGPDNIRQSDGFFAFGNLTHLFSENLSLKVSFANETLNGDHRLRLGNLPGISSRENPLSDTTQEPNNGIEYNPENAEPDTMPSPYQKLYWQDQDVDSRIDALRSTVSWKTEILGSKQQILVGLDYDKSTAEVTKYDLIYDDAIVSTTGYWDMRSRVNDYFLLNDEHTALSPGISFNHTADFSQNFNKDASFWEFEKYGEFSNLAGSPTFRPREGDSGYFQLSETQDREILTFATWIAAQGSYLKKRLNTLIGLRFDRIELENSLVSYSKTFDPIDANASNQVDGRDPLRSETKEEFTQVSPTVGALYWLNKNFALFGNYAKSIQSPVGGQIDPIGKSVEPEIGIGYEGGVKFQLLDDKIIGQLIAFYIQKENDNLTRLTTAQLETLYPQSLYPSLYVFNGNRDAFTPIGRQVGGVTVETQGFEADLYYNPTNQLSFFGGYAYTDSSYKDTPLGIADGQRYPGSAFHSANLTARYRFTSGLLKGCYFGGNQKYRSESFYGMLFADVDGDGKDDPVGDDVRGYELWLEDNFQTSLFAGWDGKLKQGRNQPYFNLQFTVHNLFDEVSLINTGNAARFTNGRSFSLRASATF